MVSAELKSRVLAATRSLGSPTRQSSVAKARLALVISVVMAAVLFFHFDGPRHGQGRPAWFYATAVLAWTAVAALSVWGAFARGRSALGPPTARLTAVYAGTPAVLFGVMYWIATVHPELTDLHAERVGYRCLALTVTAAAFPFVAWLRIRRGSDPVHPRSAGAALGAACGASTGVMVELWCPVAAPRHIAVGHILPIAILAILGAIIGGRILALRSSGVRR